MVESSPGTGFKMPCGLSGGDRKCHSQMPMVKVGLLWNVLESAIGKPVAELTGHCPFSPLSPAHPGDSDKQDQGSKSSETLAKATGFQVSPLAH